MCQSEGENFIVSRGSQFVDGTRCESDGPPPFGSTAACLRGACQVGMTQQRPDRHNLPLRLWLVLYFNMLTLCRQSFGCDGVLHSGKVRDLCGECDGDGSACTLTSGTFAGGQARGNNMKLLNLSWTWSRGSSFIPEVSSSCIFFKEKEKEKSRFIKIEGQFGEIYDPYKMLFNKISER